MSGWQAVTPGNLMLMGEHGVLHGRHALVCAVSPTMQVRLTPRTDRRIVIRSALGHDEASLDAVEVRPPFRFIWAALLHADPAPPSGFELDIESGFSDQVGFGSSAAVTVSLLALLSHWAGEGLDRSALHVRALAAIRSVQGRGSGADAAASLYGGIVLYRADPIMIEPLNAIHPITVLYSGYKVTTPVVIEQVEALRCEEPDLVDGLYTLMDDAVLRAAQAVRDENWLALGRLMNMNQGFMEALGVSDRTLSELIYFLRRNPGMLGAKISGAGLGDCVVGLGASENRPTDYTVLPAALSKEGVRIEEI